MREGAGETREDPKTAASKKGAKSDWNPDLKSGPRREFVREVLAQKALADTSRQGCVPAQWPCVSSSRRQGKDLAPHTCEGWKMGEGRETPFMRCSHSAV